MSMATQSEILKFIKHFERAEDCFLDGCCYWFAYILQARFAGRIYYYFAEGHFVSEIQGRLYDVRGDVTELYAGVDRYSMEEIQALDVKWYQRLLHDCVWKTDRKLDIETEDTDTSDTNVTGTPEDGTPEDVEKLS